MKPSIPAHPVDAGVRLLHVTALWLGIGLIAVKAAYLGLPWAYAEGGFLDYLESLAAISYADVLFTAAAWGGTLAVLVPLRSRSRSAGATWIVSIGFLLFAVCALSAAVVNVAVFNVLGGFLTYSLVQMVGNVRMVRSSVSALVTPLIVATLVAVPLAYLAAVAASYKRPQPKTRRRRRPAAVAAVAIAWVIVGHYAFGAHWANSRSRRIAQNGHWVFLSSWWQHGGGQSVHLENRFADGDLDDFEPIGLPVVAAPRVAVRRASIRTRPVSTAVRRPPNVILIVLESVAARWTSLYGSGYETTPTLQAEAAHSMVFDNFYAHIGRSSNSLSAMLLSAYPKLGFRDMTDEYPDLLGTSIASVFHDRGYRTGFITPSALAWAGWDRFLAGRGFDELRDENDIACAEPISSWGVEDRCMVDDMVRWMDDDSHRPFFLMTWTQQTHHPYEPTPGQMLLPLARDPMADDYGFGRYLNVLHETDRQIARIFDAVRRTGRQDETLIAVTGDHGQAFGSPHESFMQGRSAYEEDVRVPLMIWSPRRFLTAARSSVVGSHVDLAPTLVELAGLPPAPVWQGRSLLAPHRPARAYFYVAEDEFMLGVREDRWKYILNVRDGSDELFDLTVDPTEQANVASLHAEICARLRQRLAAWTEANRRQYLKSGSSESGEVHVPDL